MYMTGKSQNMPKAWMLCWNQNGLRKKFSEQKMIFGNIEDVNDFCKKKSKILAYGQSDCYFYFLKKETAMRKTNILLFCICLAFASASHAQYITGIGATLGMNGQGGTIIQYFAPGSRGAADLLFTSQYKGFVFTGLYEIHSKNHNERIELANVGFFGGLGGHV